MAFLSIDPMIFQALQSHASALGFLLRLRWGSAVEQLRHSRREAASFQVSLVSRWFSGSGMVCLRFGLAFGLAKRFSDALK